MVTSIEQEGGSALIDNENTDIALGSASPIAGAPVKDGEPSGPYLLTPGRNRKWAIGEWDGNGFHDLDNGPLNPTHYLLLP